MTVGSPPSRTVTTELVVPRSIPTARAMELASLPCVPVWYLSVWGVGVRLARGPLNFPAHPNGTPVGCVPGCRGLTLALAAGSPSSCCSSGSQADRQVGGGGEHRRRWPVLGSRAPGARAPPRWLPASSLCGRQLSSDARGRRCPRAVRATAASPPAVVAGGGANDAPRGPGGGLMGPLPGVLGRIRVILLLVVGGDWERTA